MIRHPDKTGVAFSGASEKDQREAPNRLQLSDRLGITSDWAEVRQVHANRVVRAKHAGLVGTADAMWTDNRRLPLAIFTADCFGVVLGSDDAIGVAHAGWRGTTSNVVGALRSEMTASGQGPNWAAIGPGIGPCCFEVGPEVAVEFEEHQSTTTWGTQSVDLREALKTQLVGLETWSADLCTVSDDGWFSFRRDQTSKRLATLAWLP